VVEIGGNVKIQNRRDHNHHGFSYVLAGGGVRGGHIHGATDDFGFKAVEKLVHVHDLHATVLHLLGLDHTRLTYAYSGRNFRLTDVAGKCPRSRAARAVRTSAGPNCARRSANASTKCGVTFPDPVEVRARGG
jgi:hypothetical protein